MAATAAGRLVGCPRIRASVPPMSPPRRSLGQVSSPGDEVRPDLPEPIIERHEDAATKRVDHLLAQPRPLLLLLLAACGAPVVDPPEHHPQHQADGGSTAPEDGGTADGGGTAPDDGGAADGGGDDVEDIPGHGDPVDPIFRDDLVHELKLTLEDEAWNSLSANGRTWVEAELEYEGRTWVVGLRLKGNTSYDVLEGKPALKVDMNRYEDGEDFFGMPSFYLQNARWDPSVMHEFISYNFFVSVGVPAARAAYADLKLNGRDYGPYVLLEKQNSAFMERWFDDDGGSIYEAGSFNYGCDLSDGPQLAPCDCFEVDKVGSEDSREDLWDLCRAATSASDDWYDAMKATMDMDRFLRAMAAEMVVSHYDNYGWNTNNYRIARLPETDDWVFTPWSVDLSFGWYPWMSGPHCGTYGVTPGEYDGGFLVRRCWRDAACTADLEAALIEQADAFDAYGVVDRIEAAQRLIAPLVAKDFRDIYSFADFETEAACMRDFAEGRGDAIRAWVDARH